MPDWPDAHSSPHVLVGQSIGDAAWHDGLCLCRQSSAESANAGGQRHPCDFYHRSDGADHFGLRVARPFPVDSSTVGEADFTLNSGIVLCQALKKGSGTNSQMAQRVLRTIGS